MKNIYFSFMITNRFLGTINYHYVKEIKKNTLNLLQGELSWYKSRLLC